VSSVPISAVIITRDSGATLRATLDALGELPEVIVYDNGSTDQTLEIAGACANVKVCTGEFPGFGPARNIAAGFATHDWVLAIDSDEVVSPGLMAGILAADLSDPRVVYQLRRRNYFMGRLVRYSGWGSDWLARLYNRKATAFDDAAVHERLLPASGGRSARLPGTLEHEAVREIGDFLVKVNRYSEIRRNQPDRRVRPAFLILLGSLWAFLRTYLFRGGFLDGWRGLVIAVSNANGVFFKYIKPYADAQRARETGRR